VSIVYIRIRIGKSTGQELVEIRKEVVSNAQIEQGGYQCQGSFGCGEGAAQSQFEQGSQDSGSLSSHPAPEQEVEPSLLDGGPGALPAPPLPSDSCLFMVFSRANRALYAACILALYRAF
jgi:hypothetical protein